MTARQFEAWDQWLDSRWNEPDRSDWYQMQTASLIHNANSKQQKRPEEFKIPFAVVEATPKKTELPKNTAYTEAELATLPKRLTKERIAEINQAASKAQWAKVKQTNQTPKQFPKV